MPRLEFLKRRLARVDDIREALKAAIKAETKRLKEAAKAEREESK